MKLAKYILKKTGWEFHISDDVPDKCVVCVAPHTSNWDFIIGEICIRSVGKRAGFLMKDAWFFFPLGYLLKAIGGIPVSRKHHNNVTAGVVKTFGKIDKIMVAVTPEGTRSLNPQWHKGFLYIAKEASVPVVMGCIDYKRRKVTIEKPFIVGDDIDGDLKKIKDYFSSKGDAARYPEKFSI